MDVMQESSKRVQRRTVFVGFVLIERMTLHIMARPDEFFHSNSGQTVLQSLEMEISLNKPQSGGSRRCEITSAAPTFSNSASTKATN